MAYFPDGMPLPDPDRDTAGFWEACREHRLVFQRCAGCGAHRHTPKPVCATCQSFEWGWVESAGTGTVYTYTVVHNIVHPAVAEVVPYNAVVVELDDCDGVLLTSNLVGCPNEDLHVGMRVRVVWEDVEDVSLPRFTRA